MNKKITGIIFIFVVLFVGLSALAVNAQTPQLPTPSAATLSIGSSSQERSNPLDEDGAKVVIGSRALTFTAASVPNVGTPLVTWKVAIVNAVAEPRYTLSNTPLSNIEQVKSELEGNTGLLIVETDPQDTIGGTDVQTTIKSLIPANLDAVDSTFNQQAFRVVALTLKIINTSALPPTVSCSFLGGTPTSQGCEILVTGSVEVQMQAENILEFNDIDVEINSRERQSIDDEDTVDSRKPGDVLDFSVEVENTAPDDSNLDVRDADIDFDCDSNDIDIDDENVDLGDVNSGDTETESLNANIEEDAEDGNIGCTISSIGLDRNGARHGERIDFDVEIERKNHDIQIKTVSATPSTLSCEDTSFQLSANLLNLGTSDEDEVALEVISRPLNVQQRLISNLQLDEDDADTVSGSIALNPRDLKAGTYALQVQSFYDNVKLTDTEILQIENTCDEQTPSTPSTPTTPTTPSTSTTNALSLDQNEFEGARMATISVPVRVTNTERTSAEYVLMIDNVNEFGEQPSTKTVFLNAGQSSTVFLNLKVRDEVQDGKYSATVKLLRGDEVIEASEFVVDVAGSQAPTQTTGGLNLGLGGEGTSRVFWIIGDIVLVVIAIFFIRLIFTSGDKKKAKKMADFEPEAKRRR